MYNDAVNGGAMKKFLACLILLAIVLLGCNISTTVTQGVPPPSGGTNTKNGGLKPTQTATEVGPKPTETPAVTDTAADSPTPATNTTCNEISFYLDPSLAAGVQCETMPEFISPTGIGTNPQYTKVSLQGYVLSDRFMKPVISIFPVDKFIALLPDVGAQVTALQALIAGGAPGSSELPFLPIQYAHQLYSAQYGVLKFQNGSGIHFLTQYAQAYYPANNHDMIYSYQGLTSDGKYWVSIILPISNPDLPENGDNPPADLYTNPDPYYTKIAAVLNAEPLKSFNPSIVKLNDLIKSIVIQP
jgi:hypothetical protein